MPLSTPSLYKQIVPKTSDESVTSSTALQDDDALLYTVSSGQVWVFEFYLYTTFDTAGQIRVAVNAPATNFFLVTAEMVSNGVTVAVGTTTTQDSPITLTNTAATSGLIKVTAIAAFSAAGTVNLRWAQGVSNGSPTTVKGGSYLRPNFLLT